MYIIIASIVSNLASIYIISIASTILLDTFTTYTNLTKLIYVNVITSFALYSAFSALNPSASITKTIYTASYDGFLHIFKLFNILDTSYKLKAVDKNDEYKINSI